VRWTWQILLLCNYRLQKVWDLLLAELNCSLFGFVQQCHLVCCRTRLCRFWKRVLTRRLCLRYFKKWRLVSSFFDRGKFVGERYWQSMELCFCKNARVLFCSKKALLKIIKVLQFLASHYFCLSFWRILVRGRYRWFFLNQFSKNWNSGRFVIRKLNFFWLSLKSIRIANLVMIWWSPLFW